MLEGGRDLEQLRAQWGDTVSQDRVAIEARRGDVAWAVRRRPRASARQFRALTSRLRLCASSG